MTCGKFWRPYSKEHADKVTAINATGGLAIDGIPNQPFAEGNGQAGAGRHFL